MRLLLIGCTGFIGQELVPQLLRANHQLILVSRNFDKKSKQAFTNKKLSCLELDPTDKSNWQKGPLLEALTTVDGVVNLAGEPIAEKRWSSMHCQTIKDSRLKTTHELVHAMNNLKKPPHLLINASAIGFYGTSSEEIFTEESHNGDDFLGNLCKEWESKASQKPRSTRLVIFRIGIVLGPNGGALRKMLPIFKAGFGGPIGNGQQWMSWIHRNDICRMIEISLTNKSWSGVINAVAPKPVQMENFARTLGKTLNRPSLLPVPGPILKLLLGDGAKVVLEGQKVTSKRLEALKFTFTHPDLTKALVAATNPSSH